MKKFIIIVGLLSIACSSLAQDYNFQGTMSREKLELYLSKAIEMQTLVDENSCYFPPCISTASTLYNPTAYHININMLFNINARFIGRSCGLWGNEWVINEGYFNNVGNMVNDISTKYISGGKVKPIIQASIFEIVTPDLNGILMSNEVANTFGVTRRNFNFAEMLYSNGRYLNQWGANTAVPDMSKLETRMWFYFMATQFIDKGIEALHLGQVELMANKDSNHFYWWDLLTKIRNYAQSKNRGLVLLDAHTFGLYVGNTDQLLFDFHSSVLRPQEKLPKWTPNATNGGPAVLESNPNCGTVWNRTKGGKTHFGWYATALPILVQFDNTDLGPNSNTYGDCWRTWGWDEITWFGVQSETYRNNWLKYAYYKTKCLDENAFLEMPGMCGLSRANVPWPDVYRAATGYYNQENTIKDLWNGVYNNKENLVHHNFTSEEVFNQATKPDVFSSLVFVGNDKAYYIASSGLIYGYIKDNGTQGIWRTVSPAHACQINVNMQVLAKSDLVASPDGSTLLYIGVDGYVHGFTINDVWNYTYFDFDKNEMLQQNLKAVSNLIFPFDNRAFYIAEETATGNKRVHGFNKVNGVWTTISPTYSQLTPANSQQQAQSALTYDATSDRLYYVGMDGFLYYFKRINSWQYTYNEVPKTELLSQNIRISGSKLACVGNKIYYIGKQRGDRQYRIHALIDNNGNWTTVSPSHSANMYNGQPLSSQVQPSSYSEIAVSPNGQYIAYIGSDDKIYYYKNIDSGWNYSYNTPVGTPSNIIASNSLQYTNNNQLFFISFLIFGGTNNRGDQRVHYYNLQESYCENPNIKTIEPNYQVLSAIQNIPNNEMTQFTNAHPSSMMSNKVSINESNTINIRVYPNPADKEIHIDLSNELQGANFKYRLTNALGNVVIQGIINAESNIISTINIPSGVYILSIFEHSQNINKNYKIVIRK